MSLRKGAAVLDLTKRGGYVHCPLGKKSFGKVSDALRKEDATYYLEEPKPVAVWVCTCLQFILLLLDCFPPSTIAILLTVASLLSLDAGDLL